MENGEKFLSIRDEKKTLRKQIKAFLNEMPDEEKRNSDKKIIENVLELSEYRNASCIFSFVGVGWEVGTASFIESALKDGKIVAVPLCTGKGIMEARQIKSLSDLVKGMYDIPEPTEKCPPVKKDEIEFALLPCVCCDKNKMRLGQGGGFYDRFMENRKYFAAAVCRSAVLKDKVPSESFDLAADCVVTEQAVIR